MIFFLVFSINYFIGSIPFGILLSKIFKKDDPRLSGSNNIGATNVARISGWKLGLLTLICDILKSFLSIKFFLNLNETFFIYSTLGIFLGHLFPVWIRFNGGKGIAVLIGILFAFSNFYGTVFIFTWITVAFLFKYSSLAALVSSLLTCILIFFEGNIQHIFLIIFITILIFIKHKENLIRLFQKKESKINFKK